MGAVLNCCHGSSGQESDKANAGPLITGVNARDGSIFFGETASSKAHDAWSEGRDTRDGNISELPDIDRQSAMSDPALVSTKPEFEKSDKTALQASQGANLSS
eukprot:GEMP01058638.1.p2 GENE.GEMP01058638.1~~GEMP01058638.1.p2  ORF type:complete len:103 (+),score=17.85 GEMP01058638.1:23-331(+)